MKRINMLANGYISRQDNIMLSSCVISHSNLCETKQLKFIILCNTRFYGGGNNNIMAPPQSYPALQCRSAHLKVA